MTRNYLKASQAVAFLNGIWTKGLVGVDSLGARILSASSVKTLIGFWRAVPLKVLGATVVSAVLANGLFLVLLKKEIGGTGILIRGFLLLLGLVSLTCSNPWEIVRGESLFFRFLFPRRKGQGG